MTELCLLNSSHNILVEPESDRDGEDSQGAIGHHGDEWDHRQSHQDSQKGSKDNASLPLITPVDQIDDCE